ncbi:MAG: hypothetical protein ACYCQK_11115 [Acidiferrobacteraceae bacterium]
MGERFIGFKLKASLDDDSASVARALYRAEVPFREDGSQDIEVIGEALAYMLRTLDVSRPMLTLAYAASLASSFDAAGLERKEEAAFGDAADALVKAAEVMSDRRARAAR